MSKYPCRANARYVPLILAAIVVAQNPVQYGFDITPRLAHRLREVAVPRAVDLRRVAEWTARP